MRILVVEDDLKVQNFIKDSLQHEGHSVVSTYAVPDDSILSEKFDVIILDRLLGNTDSKRCLNDFKSKCPDSSILILSALNGPQEKAELLDMGADDYLGKPFSIVELSARVRALGRRNRVNDDYLQIGDIIINILERTVSYEGKKLDFTFKEFQLFKCLCAQVGRVYSKFQLMDIVWESNLELESNVLEVTIMNVRKKLTEVGSKVQIKSKRNIGYWVEV